MTERPADTATATTPAASNDTRTWASFIILATIWGSSFLFIKVALEQGLPPLTVVGYRLALGSAFLAAVMLLRGGRLPAVRAGWTRLIVLAAVNVVAPMALIAWGQQYIPTGMAGVLNSLVPLFAIVLAAFVLQDEPVTLNRAGGLVIGFGGVVLMAMPSLLDSTREADAALAVAGMVAMALGALFYAIGAVYTRSRLTGRPLMRAPDGSLRAPTSLEISFGNVFFAFVIVAVAAVVFERPVDGLVAAPDTPEALFAVVWLGLLGTGLAYRLFFGIVGRWGATRTTLVTYVIPIVALVLGFVLLGERLLPVELAGAALIIAGVVLANSSLGRRRLFGRADAPQDA